MNRKTLYKSRGIFPEISADKRSQKAFAERHEKQLKSFWSARVPATSPARGTLSVAPAKSKELERLQMLYKWKEERKKKLEDAKKNQKPIFKVGVVHRTATGSPLITESRCVKKSKKQMSVKSVQNAGVVTRATAKRTGAALFYPPDVCKSQIKFQNKFCKIESGKRKKIDSLMFRVPDVVSKLSECKLTFPNSPKLTKNRKVKTVQNNIQSSLEEIMQKCYSKVGRENSKEIEKITEKMERKRSEEVETTSEKVEVEGNKENLTPTKVEAEKKVTPEKVLDDYQPIHFSPFVTLRNSRKSGKKAKKSLTMNVEEVLEKEENEFKCRIFSFRKYIQCETKRLLETCDKWKQIRKEFDEIPTDVEGDIDAVIGKTKLLTSDKFVQFNGLIEKCEKGDPFIKLDDLVGFQDWVAIEVEKIDEEFYKLEKRKCSNWKVESITESKKQNIPKKAAKKPVGKSNIRSHILAARKLLKESNAKGSPITELPILNEAIKLTTPKKTSTLLKQVLTSETKNKFESPRTLFRERRNSGLEIMIATQKNKLSTPKSPAKTDYEILMEQNDKPCRSILKKTPKALSSTKGRVTFKKLSTGLRLSESYFKPTEDSPDRTILKDLGNITPGTRITRSKAKHIVSSDSQSPSSSIDPFISLF